MSPSVTPEFTRPKAIDRLSNTRTTTFDETPTAKEAEALRQLMGLVGLRKLRFHGEITPIRPFGWHVQGVLGASITQTCVVTLDPVRNRIDTEVDIRFVPAASIESPEGEGEIDETLEPLGDVIDLGLIATEALALAIPPYPRKDDAALPENLAESDDDAPESDEPAKPFAGLAALRAKLKDPS